MVLNATKSIPNGLTTVTVVIHWLNKIAFQETVQPSGCKCGQTNCLTWIQIHIFACNMTAGVREEVLQKYFSWQGCECVADIKGWEPQPLHYLTRAAVAPSSPEWINDIKTGRRWMISSIFCWKQLEGECGKCITWNMTSRHVEEERRWK